MDTKEMFTINTLKKAVKEKECQIIIHIGDIAYSLQDDKGYCGDNFMREIEKIAAYIPYMVIDGNHEFDGNSFKHYQYRFSMPFEKSNNLKYDLFYTFNVGLVNFIGISSEIYSNFHLFGPEPINRQAKWLDVTLKKIREHKKKTPWTIVYLHRPIYCFNEKMFDECSDYEDTTLRVGHKSIPGLEKYFYKYGVHLVFCGHEHTYQRTYPVYNRTVYKSLEQGYHNPPAPVHILTGAGGCRDCHKITEITLLNNSPFAA
uniref:Metallophos domain-containing protein n=1 Tax=Strongyloides papillosus TaxID=174720 RepID=A0A0N5BY08_STREA